MLVTIIELSLNSILITKYMNPPKMYFIFSWFSTLLHLLKILSKQISDLVRFCSLGNKLLCFNYGITTSITCTHSGQSVPSLNNVLNRILYLVINLLSSSRNLKTSNMSRKLRFVSKHL